MNNTSKKLTVNTSMPIAPKGLNPNAKEFYPNGLNPDAKEFYPKGLNPNAKEFVPKVKTPQYFTFSDNELDYYFLDSLF